MVEESAEVAKTIIMYRVQQESSFTGKFAPGKLAGRSQSLGTQFIRTWLTMSYENSCKKSKHDPELGGGHSFSSTLAPIGTMHS